MRILITTVDSHAEEWDGLFTALVARTDVDLSVFVADASPATRRRLGELAERHPHFQFHAGRGVFGERLVGHQAATIVPPRGGRTLRPWRPDVLHLLLTAGHALTAQVLGWRRRYWPETPVTLYAGDTVATRFPQPFRTWERQAFDAVGCAFPTSPVAEDVLRTKGFAGPAHVVPLGVDTTMFQPAPRRGQQTFTVGYVGDLEGRHGIPDLIDACERLDCDLLVVGTGSVTPDIRRALDRRPDHVVLHSRTGPVPPASLGPLGDSVPYRPAAGPQPRGPRSPLPDLLARMDVLAMPAVEPAFNLGSALGGRGATEAARPERTVQVLVEAMACGTPVVTTDVGEAPRLVGPAGLVCRGGDSDDLTGCLRRIRDEPGLAARLGAAGRGRAHLFGWVRVADNLCGHWRGLAAGQPPDGFLRTSDSRTTDTRTTDTRTTEGLSADQLGTTPATGRTQEKEGHTQ
jgi:glycosyltransferase involved in cell wall biosynthesis